MRKERSIEKKLQILSYCVGRLKKRVEMKRVRGTLLQSTLALFAKQRALVLEVGRCKESERAYPQRIEKEIDGAFRDCLLTYKELNDLLKKVNLFKSS